jgi:Spy/CpxP family protein refolding chaperone
MAAWEQNNGDIYIFLHIADKPLHTPYPTLRNSRDNSLHAVTTAYHNVLNKEYMMKGNKLILSLAGIAALIGMSTAAMAFDGERNRDKGFEGNKHGNHMERMREELNLSDEQAAKIKAIFKDKREAKKDHRDERKQFQQAMMKLDPASPSYDAEVDALARQQADAMVRKIKERAQVRKEIHLILTHEQQQKAKALHKKRMERGKDRPRRDGDKPSRESRD